MPKPSSHWMCWDALPQQKALVRTPLWSQNPSYPGQRQIHLLSPGKDRTAVLKRRRPRGLRAAQLVRNQELEDQYYGGCSLPSPGTSVVSIQDPQGLNATCHSWGLQISLSDLRLIGQTEADVQVRPIASRKQPSAL